MSDYAPLSFEDGGRVQGLSVDILTRVMDLTGLQATPVVDQWSVLIELFQQGEIDVIANISDLKERRSFTRFLTTLPPRAYRCFYPQAWLPPELAR